ncbi:MAG TPA: hypothetical protein VFQ82_15415 [Stellaceae bacterium]|nr:hypothetical protein [Stellaceae bacterium]
MNKTFRWLGMFALAAVIEGGAAGLALAQTATGPEATANASGPAQGYAVGPTNPAGDQSNAQQVSPATELPVLYITGLEVLHTQTQPPLDIVRVTGLTGSQGWSAPQLVPTFVGKPLDGILDLQFIATMPEQTQPANGFVPIGAVFTIEGGHQFKGVRVRASENAIEVDQIPGASQANITVDDCKDCVGKKFAEKGQAQAGAPGIVRQEDLPKVLRWIIPTRGIRGITHDPNRLNLILSSDNTIVAAYWE